MMKDLFGNEVVVGSNIIWVSGKSMYAGVKVFKVVKVTPKGVKVIANPERDAESFVSIDHLVVVDKLM